MVKIFCLLIAFLSLLPLGNTQEKSRMEPAVFDIWQTISRPQISNDGNWVVYESGNESDDPTLNIYDDQTGNTFTFPRGSKAKISANSQWLAFKLVVPKDTIRAMKLRKVKKEDLPNDSLVIYHLRDRTVKTIPNVQTFKMPKEWNNWLVYHEAAMPLQEEENGPQKTNDNNKPKKPRKPKKEDGSTLVFYDLTANQSYSYLGVLEYTLAKSAPAAIFNNSGKYPELAAGVYAFDFQAKKETSLFQESGKYSKLFLDEKGEQAGFIADLDTTKNKVRPLHLYYYKKGNTNVTLVQTTVPDENSSELLISDNYQPRFSKDGKTLYYGTAPFPILPDTSILKEERVNVEVWHYQDSRLHTQQNARLSDDQKATYLKAWNVGGKELVQLSTPDMSKALVADQGNAKKVLVIDDRSLGKDNSWEGYPGYKNLFLVDKKTGQRQTVAKNLRANPGMSAKGKYVHWYSPVDTAWFAYAIRENRLLQLTNNHQVPFYDELNDRPMLPEDYRIAGWAEQDRYVYINDRYDIWQVDPLAAGKKKRLTQGRENQRTYRYVKLDQEVRTINPEGTIFLRFFDHQSKISGYANLDLKTKKLTTLTEDTYQYSRRPQKAKSANRLLFTKENFTQFPDLRLSDLSLKSPKKVSDANPQQKDYNWGRIELFRWTDSHGEELQGLLVKPPNFDPTKKYPMIVNFYERSSDGLHRHRAPYPHRSTINYSYYANRGYLIFNPDVPYRVGYPGESAYSAVMPGVTALIDKGFVDRERIGLQGHSWGGYQAAYLVTKTNLFACAESGAPVVNMFSAYGGIRWGSGLSRMFQYEQTQSRIGGTIWEYPLRYLENSPIFFLDKVETPVLILHNDKDGAVPWYQGIEFFVGMRRLGKPAWLLNYNDEPHWPLKRQNRVDFNIRMGQFFDHYLMGSGMPEWMERGVPALEKGARQGLELRE